jgi:hypothetical protein
MSKDFNPKFDALRNAIYHSSRRRFFELLNRSLSFLVVISGTAAVANLHSLEPRWLAAMAAIIGALQLVFDFGGRFYNLIPIRRSSYGLWGWAYVRASSYGANPCSGTFQGDF